MSEEVKNVSKRKIILFVVFSSLAIVFVLLLNGKRNMKLSGDKPIDFVYAIENLDASMNFGDMKKSLEYFNVILNTQSLVIYRAEELYKAGVNNEAISKYLLANDPKFLLLNGTPKEKKLAFEIMNVLSGEKK